MSSVRVKREAERENVTVRHGMLETEGKSVLNCRQEQASMCAILYKREGIGRVLGQRHPLLR